MIFLLTQTQNFVKLRARIKGLENQVEKNNTVAKRPMPKASSKTSTSIVSLCSLYLLLYLHCKKTLGFVANSIERFTEFWQRFALIASRLSYLKHCRLFPCISKFLFYQSYFFHGFIIDLLTV